MGGIRTLEDLNLIDQASFGQENNIKLATTMLKFAQEVRCYKVNGKDLIEKLNYTLSLDKIETADRVTFSFFFNESTQEPKWLSSKRKKFF